MPKVLTEGESYTGSVTVPEDGDDRDAASVEVPFQALTDRTNVLHRARHCARYRPVDAAGIANTAAVGLTQVFQYGGYSLAGSEIQVPAAGIYAVDFQVQFKNSVDTDPDRVLGALLYQQGGSVYAAIDYARRYDGAAATMMLCRGSGLWEVATPASEKLSLRFLTAASPAGTFETSGNSVYGFVDLRRVR